MSEALLQLLGRAVSRRVPPAAPASASPGVADAAGAPPDAGVVEKFAAALGQKRGQKPFSSPAATALAEAEAPAVVEPSAEPGALAADALPAELIVQALLGLNEQVGGSALELPETVDPDNPAQVAAIVRRILGQPAEPHAGLTPAEVAAPHAVQAAAEPTATGAATIPGDGPAKRQATVGPRVVDRAHPSSSAIEGASSVVVAAPPRPTAATDLRVAASQAVNLQGAIPAPSNAVALPALPALPAMTVLPELPAMTLQTQSPTPDGIAWRSEIVMAPTSVDAPPADRMLEATLAAPAAGSSATAPAVALEAAALAILPATSAGRAMLLAPLDDESVSLAPPPVDVEADIAPATRPLTGVAVKPGQPLRVGIESAGATLEPVDVVTWSRPIAAEPPATDAAGRAAVAKSQVIVAPQPSLTTNSAATHDAPAPAAPMADEAAVRKAERPVAVRADSPRPPIERAATPEPPTVKAAATRLPETAPIRAASQNTGNLQPPPAPQPPAPQAAVDWAPPAAKRVADLFARAMLRVGRPAAVESDAATLADSVDPARPTAASFTLPVETKPQPAVATNAAGPGEATGGFDADANAVRIARAVASQLGGRAGGTIRLRLDPPGLGELRVELTLASNHVKVSLLPATESAAQTLAGQLHQLRESLESRGLAVGGLQVDSPRGIEQGGTSTPQRGGDGPPDRHAGPFDGGPRDGHGGGQREGRGAEWNWRDEMTDVSPPARPVDEVPAVAVSLSSGVRREPLPDRALDLVG